MCRWVVYIGHEPCLLEDVLIRPKHSLCKQVHDHYLPGLLHSGETDTGLPARDERKEVDLRNKFFNIDGVGVGWYSGTLAQFDPEVEGLRPQTYKTVRPPLNDLNFRSITANTATNCLFGHIRMATSNVVETNNHPFIFGKYLFQHNGTVGGFLSIKRPLLRLLSQPAYSCIQGTTDSEHFAALYFTHLFPDANATDTCDLFFGNKSIEQMRDAMRQTFKVVEQLQKDASEGEPSSLNLAITDGTKFLGVRYRNHAIQEPPSLYYSTSAGINLNRSFPGHPDGPEAADAKSIKEREEHGKHVIIASEPSTYDVKEWHLIPKNTFISVKQDMSVTLEEV